MLNIIFQEVYFANYALNLFQALGCLVFVFFFVRLASKSLYEESNEIEKKKITRSLVISMFIALGISLGAMFTIATIGWYVAFFRLINNIYFTFALITTLVFPFYKIFLNKYDKREPLINAPDLEKTLRNRFLFIIALAWAVVLIFLSFDLLGIPIGNLIPDDPIAVNYDIFLIGIQFTFFALGLYTILTKLILKFLPIEKRPPKHVVNSSILLGAVLAFGVWSLQLIIVEVYLSRFFAITLYQQDVRVLAIVVAGVYIVGFYLSLKYKYLPQAIEADKKIIEAKIQSMKEETLKIKDNNVILNVEDLVTYFYTEEGIVHAVEGVSFQIYQGEVLGLVGETGCGKSVTALSILQLIQNPGKIMSGSVEFEGEDLLKKSKSEILTYRGNKITMIFQDPLNSLNPVFTIGKQISETYLLHKKKELLVEASKRPGKSIYGVAREWGIQLLKDLNIPFPQRVIDRFPHELSGGMRQRVQIAMGIACSPKLLIADEPTTALDVTVQNQILKLMKELKKKFNTSILFITHDLGIISKMCDRVAVMYSGSIVEYGLTETIFTEPYHPYTKGLLAAVPVEGEDKPLAIIPGMVPNLIYPPSGCRFHPRCSKRFEPCETEKPTTIEVAPNYFVNCHLYDPKFNRTEEVIE